MSFRVLGLDAGQFRHLYGLSDADLAAAGAKRYVVDATPGFPDRVEVRDLDVGEQAILLNFEHQPADTPYRSRHAIFVREGATHSLNVVDTIPDVIRIRPISLRAFSDDDQMVDADLVDGDALAPIIERFFSNPAVAYLQAHYAKRGCYAARIVRTSPLNSLMVFASNPKTQNRSFKRTRPSSESGRSLRSSCGRARAEMQSH